MSLNPLPLSLLSGLSSSGPLSGGRGSGGSTPLLTGSAVPASGGGTGEASSGSLPVTTSDTGLDGSRGSLLLGADGLLLLDLLLGLGLGVTV